MTRVEALPVVVDPGPLISEHLEMIMDQAGGRIAEIILTHRPP